MMEKKNKFIIIAGPTAVGKTKVSIEVAKRLDGEIISADSMQIYKFMDIGTAKISEAEMGGIPHHMIDIIDPDTDFTVSDFSTFAKKKIDDIISRDKTPIIVGGTGLYINSLLYDMDFNDSIPDKEFRQKLESIRAEKGNDYIHRLLQNKNPIAAESIHPNNFKRVIRALEILESNPSFELFSSIEKPVIKPNCNIFILSLRREILYNRINARVDEMIRLGLKDEVHKLIQMGYQTGLASMKGIGYRQMMDYYEGNMTLSEAIDKIKRDSRRYAKRQLTWFKRYSEAIWLDTEKISSKDLSDHIVNNFLS